MSEMEPKAASYLGGNLARYVRDHSVTPDELQRRLIAETRMLGESSVMQIDPEQGAFLTLIAKLVSPTHALEVGTFTGYSSLCIARALPPGGHLLCCDVSEAWTTIARRYWKEAGVSSRVSLRLGPATETLSALPDEASFDLVFIDADKPNYVSYWELVVPRLRTGGIVLADNVLKRGLVADRGCVEEDVSFIRAFNDAVSRDARVDAVIVPIGDGLTFARKRSAPRQP